MADDPITAALQRSVDQGALAGAATLISRRGRAPEVRCAGLRDLDAGLPVVRDTVFRIASLSKPVTSVAALTVFDEGRFTLDEPIAGWAPEFARMRVLRQVGGRLDDTVAAERPITFGDLLTHRSGLTHGGLQSGALAEAHAALGATVRHQACSVGAASSPAASHLRPRRPSSSPRSRCSCRRRVPLTVEDRRPGHDLRREPRLLPADADQDADRVGRTGAPGERDQQTPRKGNAKTAKTAKTRCRAIRLLSCSVLPPLPPCIGPIERCTSH